MPSTQLAIESIATDSPPPTSLIELRGCPRCQSRLVAPANILGQLISCPECSCETRALAAAGPTTIRPRPTPPPSQAPTLTDIPMSSTPTLLVSSFTAPLPEARRENPAVRKQQLLDFVGWMHIAFGGLFLGLVAIMLMVTLLSEQFRNWNSEGFGNRVDTNEHAIELLVLAAMGIIGFGMLSIANDLWDRTRFGWRIACVLAFASLVVVMLVVVTRVMSNLPIFGSYLAFVIVLFTLSGGLTLGFLLQPRYRRAYGRLE
jgi:hypothetical protein